MRNNQSLCFARETTKTILGTYLTNYGLPQQTDNTK